MGLKNKNQKIIAISGVKDSGKTTLVTKLIPLLMAKNLKIATIKHDGHDFQPDVKGTDTYKHREAGAYGVAIFSKNKWMVIKEEQEVNESLLIANFPEADLIILEGFKYSTYPKVEIVRSNISEEPVSNPENIICYISDLEPFQQDIKQFKLDEIEAMAEYIYEYIKG